MVCPFCVVASLVSGLLASLPIKTIVFILFVLPFFLQHPLGEDDNGTVRYATRRTFVAGLTFEQKTCNIEVNDSINQKFIEISTRQASFNGMHTDEKIAEIANLIENMLKQGGNFITPEYENVCCGFINDEIVKSYRKKMQCFRHCSEKAIAERKAFSEGQKNFLIDYGLTIVKAIHTLTK